MPLHLAVHIVIVQFLQIVREPVIIDGKQTEERRLSCTLSTDKAKHDFKFTSGLEYSADSSQHKELQGFISVLVFL